MAGVVLCVESQIVAGGVPFFQPSGESAFMRLPSILSLMFPPFFPCLNERSRVI